MKLDTFSKYRWTGELYMPVETQDGQYVYEPQRVVNFDLVSGMAQTYVYSKEPIEWAGMLLIIVNDAGDRPYYVGGQDIRMYVNSSSPVFDIYGRLTGYQQVIIRTQPTGWEKAAVAAAEVE